MLDASALVDVVTNQPNRSQLNDRLRGEHIAAPAHQLAEVLSAVARMRRADLLDAAEANDAILDAAALAQELVAPVPRHLTRALGLQDRIRVADGLYVALAEERGCPLVTSDGRLAAADPPCEVVLVT